MESAIGEKGEQVEGFYHLGLLSGERFQGGRPVTQDLADWAYSLTFEDLPKNVVDGVKYLALNAASCSIPGVTTPGSRAVLRFVKDLEYAGPCSAIGTTITTGPQYAALINGVAHCGYSLFDSHREAQPTHLGPSFFPAAFAVSQLTPTDFPTFATALAVAYEVGAKLGMALNPGVGSIDTHQVNTLGVALLTCKLLHLDRQQFSDALGMACQLAAGLFWFHGRGYPIRQASYGWLACQGIQAALLARAGYPAPEDMLEAPYGFINQFSSKPDLSWLDTFEDPWELPRNSVKQWQGSRYMHSAVDGVVELCIEHDLKPSDIRQIVLTHGSYIHSLGATPEAQKRNPVATEDGRLSLYYFAAVAALYRRAWITELQPEVFFGPEVKEMIKKVKCEADTRFDPEFPAKYTCVTTIKTTDGRTLSIQIDFPKGEPENPISWAELEDIYRAVYRDGGGAEVMTRGRHEEILERIKHMEAETDVGALARLLASDLGFEG